ncbi:MAG TPA: MBL fold metallo-hydrolase, partial [Burkholderiales bacterium]|nr:MBL fold metallo-hydrolase [Burkholderiales bacterium]
MSRAFLLFLFLFPAVGSAQERKVEVRWLSHAAFRIVSPGGKVIVVDPAMSAFATTPAQYKTPEGLGKVDLLLVTHGHWDHITDAPAIA